MLPAAKKTGENSYEIEYEGLTYEVTREDGKFYLGEAEFKLLRDLKEHLITLEEPEKVEEVFLLWDTTEPAALLVLAIQELGREPTKEELRTIDECGYASNGGKMDGERAEKEIKRIIELRKRKNGN